MLNNPVVVMRVLVILVVVITDVPLIQRTLVMLVAPMGVPVLVAAVLSEPGAAVDVAHTVVEVASDVPLAP